MNTFTCSDFVVQKVSTEEKTSDSQSENVKKTLNLKMAEVKHCCDANGSPVSD